MNDKRVVKLSVRSLKTIIDALRIIGRNIENEAWLRATFGVTRQEAVENIAGDLERTVDHELIKKAAAAGRVARLLAEEGQYPQDGSKQRHCLDPSCPCMK